MKIGNDRLVVYSTLFLILISAWSVLSLIGRDNAENGANALIGATLGCLITAGLTETVALLRRGERDREILENLMSDALDFNSFVLRNFPDAPSSKREAIEYVSKFTLSHGQLWMTTQVEADIDAWLRGNMRRIQTIALLNSDVQSDVKRILQSLSNCMELCYNVVTSGVATGRFSRNDALGVKQSHVVQTMRGFLKIEEQFNQRTNGSLKFRIGKILASDESYAGKYLNSVKNYLTSSWKFIMNWPRVTQ